MDCRLPTVTRDQWARVKDVVAGALDLEPADRPAYLDAHCGPHESLRREIDSLLAASIHAADLYERPLLLVAGAPITLENLEWFAPTRRESPASANARAPEFRGTERYALRRRIGAGGMGIVYEAEDRSRGQVVALKTLQRWHGSDIYRLKQEFRSLADIAHPNLVTLYDLIVDRDTCFFTMELLEGTNLVDYVRGSGRAADAGRIRRTLPQVIAGLCALHQRGKLHRDIKPSNVLVTRDGRVVILDFGLTSSIVPDLTAPECGLAGTPTYLSPEQCAGERPMQHSDWYGVGATVYHALTGRPPFDGAIFDVIDRKQTTDPPAPSAAAAGVPPDFDEVCLGLLRRDPSARMTGEDVLRCLDVTTGRQPPATARESIFIGRTAYLDTLDRAFSEVQNGLGASVYVHGPSGIGKTALVQAFVERAGRGQVLVLRSRCHEHESIPYKGLDGVIDSLSRYLAALPSHELTQAASADAGALARLFPVMHAVGSIDATAGRADPSDPVVLRRRAFSALRALLARVASRQPLIVHIDDFHWADADSAVSLAGLLRPPNPPPLLLIVSFRTEEMAAKPFLRELIERLDTNATTLIPMSPMSDEEVDRLVSALIPAESDGVRREIVREAGGNPFLVEQLTHDAALGCDGPRRAPLVDILTRRLASLPAGSRAFLETLAVCARPMIAARVYEACGLTGDERPLVALLRAEHFVRSSRSPEHVELYHDRIRETLAAHVPPDEVRRTHELMARILVARGDDDPEALYEHYRQSEQHALAAQYAAAAAMKASAVLAFDRAAALYRDALELHPESGQHLAWTVALARALENSGRPVEAADAYVAAADDATGAQRVEWLRKAAEQLLMGGHIDRGLAIIRRVLPVVGAGLAQGPRRALASVALQRAQLAWRGLDFTAREESAIGSEDLLRIDACWAISTGLLVVDTIRAASFQTRQLRLALDVGEPYRIARALALEACLSAAGGGRAGMTRSAAFAARAQALAERVHHPHVVALSALTAGVAAFVLGQWTRAADLCESAAAKLRDGCTGVMWELTLAHNFFLGALWYRGELGRVAQILPRLLETARERGNLYFETELTTRFNMVWLVADDPDSGERLADDTNARWSDSGYHRQHYNHRHARVQTALYRGRAADAWALVGEHAASVRRYLWLRVQLMRIESAFLRARCALAMAAEGHDARRMRRVAAHDARRIAREHTPASDALALLVRATLAHLAGDPGAAVDRLTEAVAAFDRAGMQLYAAVARRRLGALLGGDRGGVLQRQARAWMAGQQVRNPAAMARLLAPGFQD